MREPDLHACADSPTVRPSRADTLAIVAFMVAIVGGEVVAVMVGAEAAVIYESVVLGAMSLYVSGKQPARPALRALIVLAIVPLVRIASIALPQQTIPRIYWDALPAAVALFAVGGLRLLAGERLLPWWPRSTPGWVVQTVVALAGVPLAVVAVWGALPLSLHDVEGGRSYATVVALAGFAALALEVVFRGAIQPALVHLFGWRGVGLTTLLYAALFLGTGSAWLVLAALVTGVIWGTAVAVTRALGGAVVSHVAFAMVWAAAWLGQGQGAGNW